MADAFLETQITATESQITALNEAILFLSTNPHKSYQLDTGQSSQRVTRDNLLELQQQLDILINRRASLQARCNGAVIQLRPGF